MKLPPSNNQPVVADVCVPMNYCSQAVGLAISELAAGAEVQEVAALAEQAMEVVRLDTYAMSCAVMFAQPLLAPGSGFDWHAALTAGISLSAKLLCEDRLFASDAAHFTASYSAKELVNLEARAFAVWLPKIAHIHELAFTFRTSLLDLVLEHTSSSCAVASTYKEVTILIVEENDALRAQHEAVARAVAPNAAVLCAGDYAAARYITLAREEACSPVHLILIGACADEACDISAKAKVRSVTDFVDAVDPRKGVIHTCMRERPLTATVFRSAVPGAVHQALWGVVDAALPGGRVTPAALHILLDFVCERHLGELNDAEQPIADPLELTETEQPIPDPLAVAAAQAAEAAAHIWEKGAPVPTPLPPRSRLASRLINVDPLAVAAAQAAQTAEAAAHIWERGGAPIPTPLAPRSRLASRGVSLEQVSEQQPPTPSSGEAAAPAPRSRAASNGMSLEQITEQQSVPSSPAAPAAPAPQAALAMGGFGLGGMGGSGFGGAPVGGAPHAPLAPLPPQKVWQPPAWAAPPLAPITAPATLAPMSPPMSAVWEPPPLRVVNAARAALARLPTTLPPPMVSVRSATLPFFEGNNDPTGAIPPAFPPRAAAFAAAPFMQSAVQPTGGPKPAFPRAASFPPDSVQPIHEPWPDFPPRTASFSGATPSIFFPSMFPPAQSAQPRAPISTPSMFTPSMFAPAQSAQPRAPITTFKSPFARARALQAGGPVQYAQPHGNPTYSSTSISVLPTGGPVSQPFAPIPPSFSWSVIPPARTGSAHFPALPPFGLAAAASSGSPE